MTKFISTFLAIIMSLSMNGTQIQKEIDTDWFGKGTTLIAHGTAAEGGGLIDYGKKQGLVLSYTFKRYGTVTKDIPPRRTGENCYY